MRPEIEVKKHVSYPGVFLDRGSPVRPWKAVFQDGRHYKYLGHFKTADQAANAYAQYEKKRAKPGLD